MKVLFLTTSFPRFEGDHAGSFVFNLAKHLKKGGVEIDVIVPNEGRQKKHELIEGLKIHRFSYFSRRHQKLAFKSGIPENLRKNKLLLFVLPFFLISFFLSSIKHVKQADIIQCLWFPLGVLGIFLNFFHKKKLIVNLRGSDRKYLKKGRSLLSIIILRKSDALIAVGKELLKEINTPDKKKLFFIPNGVDVSSKKKFEFDFSQRIILFAGNLTKNKSVNTLLDAAKIIKKTHNFKLVIVGEGPEKKSLEEKAQGLEEKIKFLNFLPQKELFYLLEKSHVLVLPSLSEGRSNIVLEGFASGLPVIASDIPANREIVIDKATGFLFTPKNQTELAEKIALIFKRENLRDELVHGAKKFIQDKNLTWDNTAKKYIKIYKNIFQEKEA